jgi:ABC-2 type transport system ATP-binding protein
MSDAAVQIDRLSRAFRHNRARITALEGISVTIEEGQIVGLLGSNGAGKTTLIKILATLLSPTSGTAQVFGFDVARDMRRVREITSAIFGGDRGLYGRISGRDNLTFFATLNGARRRDLRRRVARVLNEMGLSEVADRRVETYSRGMRQRLHLAIGLISTPRLLLLDEPTVGLDPVEAERLRGAISRLRSAGVTVLLTSHYLLDIERLADRIILLRGGRIVDDMGIREFASMAGYTATVRVRGRGDPPPALDAMFADVTVVEVVSDGLEWSVTLRIKDWGPTSFGRVNQFVSMYEIVEMDVIPLRLEDVYAQLEQ